MSIFVQHHDHSWQLVNDSSTRELLTYANIAYFACECGAYKKVCARQIESEEYQLPPKSEEQL